MNLKPEASLKRVSGGVKRQKKKKHNIKKHLELWKQVNYIKHPENLTFRVKDGGGVYPLWKGVKYFSNLKILCLLI